ncbi:MAG: hypothetical protein KDH93_13835, partial [Rhodoferax sp.]|nr:hypothetical protein [Rhodoferax sp.]
MLTCNRGIRHWLQLVALGAAIATSPTWAQTDYPNKTIRVIVPFSPGGASDTLGRMVAQHLGNAWGQTALVENRPGAGGNIGAEAGAKATPDGYTRGPASRRRSAGRRPARRPGRIGQGG